MRKIFGILLLVLVFAGCRKPKTIPDDKLTLIVSEVFLANAYWDSGNVPDSLRKDTVDFYTPILNRYGYRMSDLMYTINSLSKRKSVKFTDILESVTMRLEEYGGYYSAKVALIDSIQGVADEMFKTEVYRDSMLRITKLLRSEDDPNLSMELLPGRYELVYGYLIDTTDKTNIQYMQNMSDSAGRKSNYQYRTYTRGSEKEETIKFELTNERYKTLNMYFAYSNRREIPKVNFTIDSIKLTRFLPKEEALDSLDARIRFRPAEPDIVEFFHPKPVEDESDPKDFVTLRVDTAGLVTIPDSLVRR